MRSLLRLPTRPCFWGLVALLLFLALGTPWVYPGSGATLMAQLLGVWGSPADGAAHPLVALLFGGIAKLLPAAWGVATFNALTALFGALCVWLTTRLAANYLTFMTDDPRSRPYLPKATAWAVALAGLALVTSPDLLRAATHFQWQIFDLFLLLGALLLTLRTAENGSNSRLACAAFIWGFIAPESSYLLALAPLGLLGLLIGWICAHDHFRWKPLLAHFVIPAALGLLLTSLATAALALASLTEGNLAILAAQTLLVRLMGVTEILQGPWILLGFFGAVPGVLAIFAARELCANSRTPAAIITYLSVVVILFIAQLPIAVAPTQLAREWSEAYPVILATLTAFAAAFVGGVGTLLISVRVPPEGSSDWPTMRKLASPLACGMIGLTLVGIVGFGTYSAVRSVAAEWTARILPKTYADKILALGEGKEWWLLGDGMVDPYLALRIAETKAPTTLFALSNDESAAAIERVRAALNASPYFTQKPELQAQLNRSLDLRISAFIQDWLKADPESLQMFATLSLPDLWYISDRLPLPSAICYRGSADRESQHRTMREAGSADLDTTFPAEVSEEAFGSVRDFAQQVRRQLGFVANNTAFYLADAGREEEALALFRKVYAYDPENVSALFNIFELVNGGLSPELKEWCEREINALTKQLSGRRYRLWALARTYGYIRSPQLMSALAGAWAMSGQTGAALSGLDLAWEMLDDGQRTALQGAVAALYSVTPGRRAEAIRRTKELLGRTTDPQLSLVYLRELIRMTILQGDLAEAKRLLEKAEQSDGKGMETLGYERALYYASAGAPAQARMALQTYLERHPKSVEANAMLATLQVQAGELDELRNATLPRLITAAGTEDDYFVQIIMAQLAERSNDLLKARTAYLRALALKPEVNALRTTVLMLDIRMDDKPAAARHARQFLYHDRALPLANYVMGALALGENDLRRAQEYLTLATAPEVDPPLPEAFNDLAETQRRLGRWAAALSAAQRACELAPNLAVAYETAAASLLGLGRLAEAHAQLDKAEELDQKARPGQPMDPRFIITRARIHLAEGHPDLARGTLVKVKPQVDTLDKGAREEYEALAKEINLK